MAFCNRLGSLLKHTIAGNAVPTGQGQMTSMYNAIRCMSTKLFIGGLSYGVDDQSLREAFACFGDVVDAKVIIDRDSGRSRGFGFVNFSTDESASSALSSMDGQELNGRNIRVSYAEERRGGGGGRPSYGGRPNSGGEDSW